jgi:hypothetical protein
MLSSVVKKNSQLLFYFFGHYFFIFDDILNQFYQNFISFNDAIILSIEMLLYVLNLSYKKGRILYILTLALLYDLSQNFRRLFLVPIQFFE